jgi:hypothetical protein
MGSIGVAQGMDAADLVDPSAALGRGKRLLHTTWKVIDFAG